jgi:hypothetical protein
MKRRELHKYCMISDILIMIVGALLNMPVLIMVFFCFLVFDCVFTVVQTLRNKMDDEI